jgi:subtilisin-like proprotein convertase family protein
MRKFYYLLFSLLLSTGYAAMGQCTNTSSFGSATINTTGTTVTISTCSFAGEYSTISGAVNGQTLRFTSSVATDFITIHSGTSAGPVVASGTTPLVFANTFTGTLFAHWNTPACGSDANCRTTTVQCTSCVPPPPPVNDLCAGAININCAQTIAGTTAAATPDAVGTCITALGTAPGVWYSFAGDGSLTTLSLCGSGYDTKIGVFSGSCGSLVCVTGNDDFCGLQSQVTFTANVGTTYYILVTGFSTNSGAYTLARTCVFPCSGVPSPGAISGPASVVCSGANATLTLSGFTTGVTGITFQWKSSLTPGGPYTSIAGATNSTYTFATNTTAYFICTVTCTNGGGSSSTAEFKLTVNKPVHSAVSATPSTTCTPGASAITGTVSGGITTGGSGVLGTSGTINLAIPDNVPAGANSVITLPATAIALATDLKIRINASHTWVGDLKFTLTSPCGTTFLFDRPGVPVSIVGNSDNLGTSNISPNPPPAVYTFDLAGATVIPETNVGTGFIASGTYRPSDVGGAAHTWAGFTFPCAGGGAWTLNVSDNAGLDLGTLVDWAIIGITAGNYTHTLTGPGTIVQNPSTGPNNSTANFSVSAIPAGVQTYTLTSTDVTGCSVSSPVTVTVNQTPVVTITPAAPVICSGNIQQLTGTAVPGVLQTFTSGAINLAIPDNVPAGVTTAPIVLPAALSIANAGDLRIRINARHSWVGDLKFTLTSPCGTTFLFDRPGVPASTFGNSANLGTSNATTPPPAVYTFDLAAATVIPETAPGTGFIPTGSYRPSDVGGAAHNWAGFTFPCTATGNWTLNISDNGGGDVGVLVDWSILYTAPSPVIFTPITNLFTNAGATTPYIAGTPVTTVWTNAPVTTTYTATSTIAGCTNTANVTVTVNQLPAVTAQPVALAAPICPGFNVTYTVGATGAGLTYQWQLSIDNGTTYNNLANAAPYSGVTTSSLLITNVATSMTNYRYRCVVSGTCPPAATSNAVTLVVATAPVITTNPANVTICANANTSFSVVAAGIPTPTIYQWQVSTDGGATWTNLTTGTAFTPTFNITAAATTLSGNRYRCIVTNNCGQTVTSTAATLTVNPLPVVTVTSLTSTRICLSDTLIPLSGSPVGGSWSGIGVSGFNFVPGVTAVGTYTLTYTFTNTFGCTATATTIAKVEDCPERQRLLRDNAVILYPNPNKGQFFLRMNSTLYNYLGVKVYNMTGQLVNGNVVNEAVSSPVYGGLVYGRVIPINLGNLPSGTYMVKVYYDDGIRTSEKGFVVVIGR